MIRENGNGAIGTFNIEGGGLSAWRSDGDLGYGDKPECSGSLGKEKRRERGLRSSKDIWERRRRQPEWLYRIALAAPSVRTPQRLVAARS
jgi:hypothetical protein